MIGFLSAFFVATALLSVLLYLRKFVKSGDVLPFCSKKERKEI